jgi:hypothetical protein
MLPGFRFLFAAIMLSMSLLVFGLGAAALLRAAHESFASNSSWRAAPEVTFAQRTESTLPVLATLRVDTPVMETAPDQTPAVEASPAMATPASEQVAAVRPVDAAPATTTSETTTSKVTTTTTSEGGPAMLPAENPAPAATPPSAETITAGDQTATAAIAPPSASAAISEPATAQLEPTSASQETPAADQTGSAATKIATLGGPPVDIIEGTVRAAPAAGDGTAKSDLAKADQKSTVKRRVQARRVLHRRRLAAHARLAAQAQQQQANPFATLPAPAVVTPRR